MNVKPITPTLPLANGRPYTPAAATDITKTWCRFGWVPPDRKRQAEAMARLNPLPIPMEAVQ
jgi:hypothetical protein